MDSQQFEKELHVSRYIIIYKFVLGLLELILGIGILLFGKQAIETYQNFKSEELLEDPHDLLITITEKLLLFVLEHQGYIVLILILLGVVKITGAIGLFYHRHWGLDILVILTLLLLPFQTYSLVFHPSIDKAASFVINILIALYLVQFKPAEYFVRVKNKIKHRKFY